ncbi:MAG: preprotein translocase subunit SecE [Betaproteobacteria bacterium]|nr:preprotein translocase subunit SecE [Betaproteobacteria bacterium]
MTAIDKTKLWIAALMALAAFYFGFHGDPATPLAHRAGALLGGLVAAAGLLWFSQPGRDFMVYCRESALEVRKVVWPKKDETIRMTGVVLVFVTIVALFLWMVDAILASLLSLVAL